LRTTGGWRNNERRAVPLYDFHCRACGHDFEALVRPQDAGGPVCPSCGGRDLERLLSTFAVSSPDRRSQAAAASVKKAATAAKRDNIQLEREAEHHRKEDH
jgi:putative FmdB family regulatory protein